MSEDALPGSQRQKTAEERRKLADASVSSAYVGAWSGDSEVLEKVSKGETCETNRDALDKLGAAGITRSVMILNGLEDVDKRQASQRPSIKQLERSSLGSERYIGRVVIQ